MTTHKTILALILALGLPALGAPAASAHTARELITSIGPIEHPAGVAVDLETGNVYVLDLATETVDIFGADGGPPADGVPSQITGLNSGFDVEFFQGIAVDNSCFEHQPRLTGKACEEYDPSYGDIYIAMIDRHGTEKLKLEGGVYREVAFFGSIEGREYAPSDVAVDVNGNVYESVFAESQVIERKKIINEITNGSGVEEPVEETQEIGIPQDVVPAPVYLAIDNTNDLYLGAVAEDTPRELGVGKITANGSGNILEEEIFTGRVAGPPSPRSLAVDPTTGDVFVGDGSEIAEYNSAGVLQLMFGSREVVGGSLGIGANGADAIAVSGPDERVYVVNPAKNDVDVFGGAVGPPSFPEAQPAVEGVSRTSAVIAGSVNPESSTANYYFEYVEAGAYQLGSPEPYREGGRTAVTALAGGHAMDTVNRIILSGLRPGTTYHYRMVASNASATVDGPDGTFTTAPATPPTVATGGAVEVSATGATLTGVVGPRGLSTSYVFEIGTDTGYAGAKLFGNAGASTGEVPVNVVLQYLVPGTTYHYRLVASSFDGTSYGQDGSFTTPGVPGGVAQPAGVPLIASPSVQFPSLAGAITVPKAHGKTRRRGRSDKRNRAKQARKARSGGRDKRARRVVTHRSG